MHAIYNVSLYVSLYVLNGLVIIRCFEVYVTMTSVVVVVVVVVGGGRDQLVLLHWNVGGVCVSKGQLLVPLSVHRGWRRRCCSTFPSGDSRLNLAASQDARELRGPLIYSHVCSLGGARGRFRHSFGRQTVFGRVHTHTRTRTLTVKTLVIPVKSSDAEWELINYNDVYVQWPQRIQGLLRTAAQSWISQRNPKYT